MLFLERIYQISQNQGLSGVPNALFVVGYTTASWTLRADLVSLYFFLYNHYVFG